MTRTSATWAVMLVLSTLAGCSDSDSDNRRARTTIEIAQQEIGQNTAETAVPIEVNDLPISDADTTENGLPQPI